MTRTIVDIIHYGITIFVILGGLLTNNTRILIFHLFASLNVLIHWIINNNKCMMSEACGHEDNDFTLSLFRFCNLESVAKNETLTTALIYILLVVLIMITYLKLLATYNTINSINTINNISNMNNINNLNNISNMNNINKINL